MHKSIALPALLAFVCSAHAAEGYLSVNENHLSVVPDYSVYTLSGPRGGTTIDTRSTTVITAQDANKPPSQSYFDFVGSSLYYGFTVTGAANSIAAVNFSSSFDQHADNSGFPVSAEGSSQIGLYGAGDDYLLIYADYKAETKNTYSASMWGIIYSGTFDAGLPTLSMKSNLGVASMDTQLLLNGVNGVGFQNGTIDATIFLQLDAAGTASGSVRVDASVSAFAGGGSASIQPYLWTSTPGASLAVEAGIGNAAPVPEPGSGWMAGLGLMACLAAVRRHRRR